MAFSAKLYQGKAQDISAYVDKALNDTKEKTWLDLAKQNIGTLHAFLASDIDSDFMNKHVEGDIGDYATIYALSRGIADWLEEKKDVTKRTDIYEFELIKDYLIKAKAYEKVYNLTKDFLNKGYENLVKKALKHYVALHSESVVS